MSCSPGLAHPLPPLWRCTYQEFHYTGNLGTVCCFRRTERNLGCVSRNNDCGIGYPLHYTGSTLTTLTTHLKSKIGKTDNITKKEKDPLLILIFTHDEGYLALCMGLSHTSNPEAFAGFHFLKTNNCASIISYLSGCGLLNMCSTNPWWSTAQHTVIFKACILALWSKTYKELDWAMLHEDLQVLRWPPRDTSSSHNKLQHLKVLLMFLRAGVSLHWIRNIQRWFKTSTDLNRVLWDLALAHLPVCVRKRKDCFFSNCTDWWFLLFVL